ncbi:MAG TPA: anthranilate/aminodeoxychorismate synthase component II [Dehalococcoidia bacterium]|nr:anthranilate/aminodeoxychorismate synthase component II [Dehalococcoidia bacterium]
MILIIDNYDSFVYNLAQYVGELGGEPVVFRNDQITIDEIADLQPSHIIISPGPCTPLESGISTDVIIKFAGKIPILGVCLGHQCIGSVYGNRIIHSPVPTHGKSSDIYHDGKFILKGLPCPFKGGRYHSLIVECKQDMGELEITARTQEGMIMGLRHKKYSVDGVQFHPESIMTEVGHTLIANFLNINSPIRQGE